jgi:tetratricopeptide (TPR) repeat protein
LAGAVSAPPKQEPAVPPPSRTQAEAAREVIGQAQSLWEQGSQDAATQLLRDAVAVLERSALAGESTAMLAQATRELTRMELARGHAAAAMDLLQRLEPLLANQADVWAVRGNAAQRLGRHAESVQAYLTALKLRPGEARWMLGAAVSLAAEGHTAQAAELAEQARERGALSAEVESYLRQQGVVLRRP